MFPHGILMLDAQLKELWAQLKEKNLGWFTKVGIDVADKKSCWLLNKNPYCEHNHWNDLTQGLILDRGGSVWSFPFTAIHGLGRKETPRLDFEACEMVEKLNGEMVCVTFPYADITKHFFHTKSWTCDDDDGANGELIRELDSLFDNMNFSYMDLDVTFVFEYIDNKLYPKERHGLHLIGARRLDNKYEEYSEDDLDAKATFLKVQRPERWHNLTKWTDITRIMNESPSEFEGFILRNKETGSRIKFEKEIYNRERPCNIFVKWKYNMPISESSKDVVSKLEESIKNRTKFLRRQIKTWKIFFDAYPESSGRDIKRNALRVSNEPQWSHKFILQFVEEDDFSEDAIRKEMMKLPDDVLRKILGVP